jgi:hypothetical protein
VIATECEEVQALGFLKSFQTPGHARNITPESARDAMIRGTRFSDVAMAFRRNMLPWG